MEAPAIPPKYVSPKGMWVSKLILRIISAAVSTSIVAITGSLTSGMVFSWIPFVVIGPVAIVALCWEMAEGICILARGGHRGIHPGANVALDLLLWLALAVTLAILGVIGIAESTLALFDVVISSKSYSTYVSELNAAVTKGQVVLGLGSVLAILHFTTFVIACYETNVRNRMGSRQIIYITNPAPPAAFAPNMIPVPQGQVPMNMQPVYFQQAPVQQFQPVPMHQPSFHQVPQYPQQQMAATYYPRESVHHEMESGSPLSQPTPVYTPQEKHVEPHVTTDATK